MNLKVIIAFLIIWIVFLSVLLALENMRHDTAEEKYFIVLKAALEKLPLEIVKKEVLTIYPELATIRLMTNHMFRLKHKVLEMMHKSLLMDGQEKQCKRKKGQQDFNKMGQAVSGLFDTCQSPGGAYYMQIQF